MNECIITREQISSNEAADVTFVAEALSNICESKEAAVRFLDNVIAELDPSRVAKKRPLANEEKCDDPFSFLKVARPGSDESPEEHPDGDVITDLYDKESKADTAMITLCVMIPNDVQLCSYLIGKQGANISEIKRKTNAKTQIER